MIYNIKQEMQSNGFLVEINLHHQMQYVVTSYTTMVYVDKITLNEKHKVMEESFIM